MVANVSNHNLYENLAADFLQTQLAHKLGLLHLQRLLAASVSIIQSLNLIHTEAAQQLISPGAGCASSVKHACWIVIYIDKVTALRRRSFSVRLLKNNRSTANNLTNQMLVIDLPRGMSRLWLAPSNARWRPRTQRLARCSMPICGDMCQDQQRTFPKDSLSKSGDTRSRVGASRLV